MLILTQNLGFLNVPDAKMENHDSIPLTPISRATNADGLRPLIAHLRIAHAEAVHDHTSRSPGMIRSLLPLFQLTLRVVNSEQRARRR